MGKSFAETHPELASEWSDRNLPITSDQVTYGSNKQYWWHGKCGHEWLTSVKARTSGEKCPYCAGKRVLVGFNDLATVYPEIAAEWSDRNFPLKPSEVAPFANRKAWWKCRACGNEWETLVSTRSAGSTCPYCSGIRFLSGFNDLATTHPHLSAEWSEQNTDLKPNAVNALSRKNVWWKCSRCSHEWQSLIYTRANGGRCPVCEGREVKPGYNDLLTTDPTLCKEWDQELNGDLLPTMVQRNSCRIVWWRGKCGHSWRGKIYDRVHHGQGCTKCDQAFRDFLPYLMILYYSWEQGVQVIPNASAIIGVPLDFYFPEFHGAIIFSRKGQRSIEGAGTEQVKDYLCRRKELKLVRILEPGFPESDLCRCVRQKDESDEALAEAVSEAFHFIGIHSDIQMNWDRDLLYECFRRMRNSSTS